MNRRIRRTAVANILFAAILAVPALGSDEPPIESGLVEDVEVGLIILDVVVLDWKDKPVAGLRPEDFAVEVDLRPVPIVSVDSTCGSSLQSPNVVLAFDYQHLDPLQRSRILEWVRSAVARGATRSSEVMVVALTGSLRIEQPLSRDLDRLQSTLARMQTDPTLAGATFPHPNQDGFVQGLSSLYDVAGTFSGPTAVILYSSMAVGNLTEDDQYRDLAAQAAAARCSLYPMSVAGLTTGVSTMQRSGVPAYLQNGRMPSHNPRSIFVTGVREAVPTPLSRLARESGGSTARGSNDAGLPLVEAFERLDCSYAIAIRDPAPRDDRRRSIGVFPQRLGLRAVHASAYGGGSEEARRQSALRAAHVAPELFDKGTVRANLIPLRPASASRWTAEIAVSFPVERGADLDVVLRRGPSVVHRSKRTIKVGRSNRVTFLESIDLAPGSYTLTSVLSDRAHRAPQSVAIDVEVPGLPHEGIFLVGPILGRRSGDNVVVRDAQADDASGRFEPLVGTTLDAPADLVAITQVCAAGGADRAAAPRVTRTLRSDSGESIGALEPASVMLDATGETGCASLVDVIPARTLKRGAAYTFETALVGGPAGSTRSARVEVQPD